MHSNREAGRAAGRDRASEIVLSRNISEVEHLPIIVHGAARIAARHAVGEAVARVLAEHAAGLVHSRAGR